MAVTAQLADGRTLEFPDGTDPSVVQETVKRLLAQEAPQEKGIMGAVKNTANSFVNDLRTAYGATTGDINEAGIEGAKRAENINSKYASGVDAKKIKDLAENGDYWEAAKEVGRQAPEALVGMAPMLGEIAGGARIGALGGSAVAGPVGGVVGGILGGAATQVPRLFGQKVQEKAADQQSRGEAIDIGTLPALGTAAFDALLNAGAVEVGMPGLARQLTGKTAAELTQQQLLAAEKLAQKGALRSGAEGVAHMAATMPAIVGAQTAADRAYLGKDLTGAEATEAYKEAMYGLLPGLPLGAYSGIAKRGQARASVERSSKNQATQDAAFNTQEELAAPTPSSPLPRPTEMDTNPARPTNEQLWAQHDAAEAAKVKANADASAAAAAGDNEAYARHIAEFKEQEAIQQDALSRAEPREAISEESPVEKTRAQLEAELASLEDTTNAKGKHVKGMISKLHGEGSLDQALQLNERAIEIKKQVAALDAKARADASANTGPQLTDEATPYPQSPLTQPTAMDISPPQRTPADTARMVDYEAEQMAAGRMDTSRTAQTSLLDTAGGTTQVINGQRNLDARRQDLVFELQKARRDKDRNAVAVAVEKLRALKDQQAAVAREAEPDGAMERLVGHRVERTDLGPATEITPSKDATSDSVQTQIATLPEILAPHHEETVARIQDNLPAISQDPAKLSQVSAYLHGLRTGNETTAYRDIPAMLDTLEQGRRSETETPTRKTAWGTGYGEPRRAQQSDMFDNHTAEHGDTALAGDVPLKAQTVNGKPQQVRNFDGVAAPPVSRGRIFDSPVAFFKYLAGDALHTMRQMMGITTQTVSRAMKRAAPLQLRIEQLTANIEAERVKYERIKQTTGNAIHSVDMAHDVALRRFSAAVEKLDAELRPLQADYLKAQLELKESTEYSRDLTESLLANRDKLGAVHADTSAAMQNLLRAKQSLSEMLHRDATKDNFDAARAQQREIQRLTDALALKRERLAPAVETYLTKERAYQTRLGNTLSEIGTLHENYTRAKEALDRLAANQKRRVAVTRDIPAAKAEMEDAAQYRKQLVEEGSAARAENQQGREALRGERGETQAKVDAELGPVEEARDARLPKEDVPTDFRVTPEDSAVRERAADRSAAERKAEQERLERLDAIPGERIDHSSYRATRDAAHDTTYDENGKPVVRETTRAERKAMLDEKYKDESLPQTTRNKARHEWLQMDKQDKVAEKRDGAVAELRRLTEERIPYLEQQVADAPNKSNKQALREARRAAKKYRALLQRVKRTEINNEKIASEPIEPGVRSEIKGRVSQASRKETKPGDQRTGSEESKGLPDEDGVRGEGLNKTGTRDPIREQRRVQEPNRAITKDEQEQANKDAEALGTKSETTDLGGTAEGEARLAKDRARVMEQEVPGMEKMLEDARERADAAETAQGITPERRTALQERVTYLEETLQNHRDAIARLRAEPEAETLEGKNVTTLKGTDWSGENEARDIDNGVVFRTEAKPAKGMSPEDVQAAVDAAVGHYTNLPEIKYVQSEADLPLRLQGAIKKAQSEGNTPGMLDTKTGKVWLIGDNIGSAKDAVLTVLHEVAGHHGLRGLLGKDYTSTMNRLYEGNAEIKRVADEHMRRNKALSKETAVEEALASMAESSPKSSMVQRLLFAIKSFLNKHFGYKNVSDADVHQLVANARRFAERGEKTNTGSDKDTAPVLRTAAPDLGIHKNSPLGKFNEGTEDTRNFREKYLKNAALDAEFRIADMHAYAVAALRSIKAPIAAQAEYAIRARDNVTSLIGSFVHQGAPEFRVNKDGSTEVVASNKASLGDFFKEVQHIPIKDTAGKYEALSRYMAAIRGLRVGAHKVGDYTKADLQAVVDYVRKNPELHKSMEAARAKYNAYNDKLVKMALDAGELTPELAKEMTEHGDYIPMYRDRAGKLEMRIGDSYVSMGDIAHTPFMHALKGGKDMFLPMDQTVFENSRLLTEMALTNQAKMKIGQAMALAGKDKGVGAKGGKYDKMYVKDGAGPKAPETLTWREGGKDKHVTLDTEGTAFDGIPTALLAQSIEGFHATMPSALKWAQAANNLLRAGVTRMPMYTLRQLLRDPMAAAAAVGIKGGPLMAVARAFKIYGQVMAGHKSESMKEIEKRGLIHNNLMTGDHDDMAALARQMSGGDAPSAIRKFLNFMDKSAHAADAATRVQIWDTAKGKGLSDAEAAHLVRESMNFHKRGISGNVQIANRALLFFNSGVQGLNVVQQAMRGKLPFEERLKHQQRFMHNALILAGMGAIYSAYMNNNDEYKKLKMSDKIGNIHFALDNGTLVKLPVSFFETGGAAWALGQAILAGYDDAADTKHIAQALGRYALTAIPGGGGLPMLPGFKQVGEWATGKDFRTFDDIVPNSVAGRTPGEQYTSTTPTLYRAIGAATDVSPAKLQHAMDSVFGQAASEAMKLMDQVSPMTGEEKSSLPTGKIPFMGSLIQNPDSSEAVDEVYTAANKAKAAQDTLNALKHEGKSATELKDYFTEHKMELAMAPVLGRFSQAMGQIKVAITQIENMPASRMSAEAKAARIQALKKQRVAIAERYNAAVQRVEERMSTAA